MDAVFLSLIVGALGGLLLGLGLGWFVGQREAAKSPKARLEKVAPVPQPGQETAAAPSLGLLLHRVEEGLEVALDGVPYRRYAAMPADSRQRLLAYLALVREWMEPDAAPPPAGATLPPPAARAAQQETEPAADEASPQAMVRQIDDILQELHAQAEISQPVRIVSGLKGGVNIMVGMERYDSLDTVPDEAVRALVKRAVKTWEERR